MGTITGTRQAFEQMSGEELRGRLVRDLPVTERRLELAGIDTALLEGGEGTPLVLLHGQGEFGAVWRLVIPELVAAGHRVVVPDLPGHGTSRVPGGKLDGERVLRWLDELVRATCPVPPVVAGHLLGGALAARYAIAHPRRVERLVLVDTLGLARYLPAPSFAMALAGFLARPTVRSQQRLFDRCMADVDDLRARLAEEFELMEAYALNRVRDPEVKAAIGTLVRELGSAPTPSTELAAMRVPTALIWGRDDLQVRLRVAQEASRRYGWPLHVVDGCADDPAVEQPSAFLDALRAVLGDRDEMEATR